MSVLKYVLCGFLLAVTALPGAGAEAATETKAAAKKEEKPLSEAEARAEFAQQDAARAAAKEGTKERAEAAQNAMQMATAIAWFAFDAARHEEAATWFDRSAALKKEHYANVRAHWENVLQTEAPDSEKKLDARIQEWSDQLAKETDEAKKKTRRLGVDVLSRNRTTVRYGAVSMLQIYARNNHDYGNLLKYSEAELTIRRAELDYLTKSGAPAKDIDAQKARVAKALEGVAWTQEELAMLEAAEKNNLEALAMRRALPADLPERELNDALGALGYMYLYFTADYKKARDYYEQALADLEQSQALQLKALEVDSYTPEMLAAMTPQEKAGHEANRRDMKEMTLSSGAMSQAQMLGNISYAAHEGGDYKVALDFAQRSLKVGESLPKDDSVWFNLERAVIRSLALSRLASLHADSGEMDLAIKELNESIEIKRAMGDDANAANAMYQAGRMFYDKGEYAAAKPSIEQARRIYAGAQNMDGVISTSGLLAMIARETNQFDQASTRAEEALTLAQKGGNAGTIAWTRRTLASIRLKQNSLAEATTLLQEAEAANARTGSVMDKISTLNLQGQVLQAQNRDDQALERFKQAIALLEDVRATAASEAAFSDVKVNYKIYERLVQLLIKMDRGEEAFDYLSRAKSKKMQDALRDSNVQTPNATLNVLLDQADALQAHLQTAQGQLQSEKAKPDDQRNQTKILNLQVVVATTSAKFAEVSDKIKAANPKFDKSTTVSPRQLKAAQRDIPDGVILVEYVPLGEQMHVFLVTNKSLKIYTLPVKTEDLWARIKTLRAQIVHPESGAERGAKLRATTVEGANAGGSLDDNLVALYDMLIAPIQIPLAGKPTVAFIPTQLLYYLPMQALARRQNGKLRYLIEDKQIVYLAGSDVLKIRPRDPDQMGVGMLAMGNPTGADLPFAQTEVTNIAKVFPASIVLWGDKASKDVMKDPENWNKRVLHFATHGILNPSTPTESYIQLATGATPADAQLTLDDVRGLPLDKVDLVTLSACQTALGQNDPDGTEITSLADAFTYAGAGAVIASLWSVSDESTSSVMVEFYKQLAAGQPKAAALQAAQVKVLKDPKYGHPFYWAPFNLMGNWR